jgi:GGDEF domain-containing protein
MMDLTCSPPLARTVMQPDLRPLHASLGRASDVLEVLEVCEATAMPYGAGLWLAACDDSRHTSYACGPGPIGDAALRDAIADMEASLRDGALPEGSRLARSIITHWREPGAPRAVGMDREYAQTELCAGGACMGLLRVCTAAPQESEGCDWEVVESIMCAAVPHLVVCLQRASEVAPGDIPRHLCTPAELMAHVEREVEWTRLHPAELALVVLELHFGQGREVGVFGDSELEAIRTVLAESLRRADVSGRLPNGRIALLLPMTGQRGALIAAERVLRRLREHPQLSAEIECQAGVSGWTFEGASGPELFEQAEAALENARRAGARGAFVFL